jgi:hypothetical protein
MRGRELKSGDKINELTVISFHHKDIRHRKYYLFQCTCGKQKVLLGSLVVSGNTKSCGCYRKRYRDKYMLSDNLGIKRQLILQYKRHARNRNFDYDLSEQEFIELITQPCHYCGTVPSNIIKNRHCTEGFKYSGIDRVNSQEGYNKNNCVPCCEKCNKAKMAMSSEEFLNWIKLVYQHSCL